MKKLTMMAGLTAGLVLQGCAVTPVGDKGLEDLTDGTVVRATVNWNEQADKTFSPASYNIEAKYFHWSKNDQQYRWTYIKAVMRRDKWGSVLRRARVADGVPLLKVGDWVDVYLPPYNSINYATLNAPVILRLVCADEDSKCKAQSEKELGGKNEVVQKGMPDMSAYTFSKVFDMEGKRLK